MLTKSEFCGLTGITSETLRHYVDVGLVEAKVNPANGYYQYEERAALAVWTARFGRSLDLPLQSLREDQRSFSPARHMEMLAERSEALRREIADLEHRRAMVEEIRAYLSDVVEGRWGVAVEEGENGYLAFYGGTRESAGRVARFADALPYSHVVLEYPLAAGGGEALPVRAGYCILERHWGQVDLTDRTGLEFMPAGRVLTMLLSTEDPFRLPPDAFAPLRAAVEARGVGALDRIYCSFYTMESRDQARRCCLKARLILR